MQKFDATQLQHTAPFHFFEEVSSTNDVAAQFAQKDAPNLTAVMAESQTNGRGRLGRQWQTYPGCALAVSVVVHQAPTLLPLMVSICIHKAVSKFLTSNQQKRLSIKWPNDILIDHQKLAGVLIESHATKNEPGKRFHIVGMGLNVTTPKQGFPHGSPAIALDALGPENLTREALLQQLLLELHKSLDCGGNNIEDALIIAYYKKHSHTFGKTVVWRDGQTETTGKATDITPEGHLILQTQSGEVICNVGDIVAPYDL